MSEASSRRAPDFSGLRVVVLGDLIVDHYLFAEPQRLSREAPVMVLSHRSEELGAGGAANVARNLAALGANVAVLGAVGRDARGRELIRILESEGIDVGGIELVSGWETPTKTRVLAAEPRRSLQQVLRIDREPQGPLDPGVRERLLARALEHCVDLDALVLSDYEYGAVSTELRPLIRAVTDRDRVAVLDPRRVVDFEELTALTPNLGELAHFVGRRADELEDDAELARAARETLARTRCRHLLVTRGNRGMALFGEGLPEQGAVVPASGSAEVTDVCGAGDTAAAVFALALAAGEGAFRAMVLANAAAGVVVMEHGAVCCSPAQLEAALGPLAPEADADAVEGSSSPAPPVDGSTLGSSGRRGKKRES